MIVSLIMDSSRRQRTHKLNYSNRGSKDFIIGDISKLGSRFALACWCQESAMKVCVLR